MPRDEPLLEPPEFFPILCPYLLSLAIAWRARKPKPLTLGVEHHPMQPEQRALGVGTALDADLGTPLGGRRSTGSASSVSRGRWRRSLVNVGQIGCLGCYG